MFICPDCRGKVENFKCKSCGFYPQNINGILDFRTKDFRGMSIPSEIPAYVKMEDIGMEFRTKNFYIPLVKKLFGGGWNKRENKNIKILDVGCGTGRVVKVLREAGYEAYGIDLGLDSSPLFWEGESKNYLFLANALSLPFEDDFFDFIISFGVMEHIGEGKNEQERLRERKLYLGEILRVLRVGGVASISFPNGAFPIDFWHGTTRFFRWQFGGSFHLPYRTLMPSVKELKGLLDELMKDSKYSVKIEFLSPLRLFRFEQVKRRTEGPMKFFVYIFSPVVRHFFSSMEKINFLAKSPLNPFLNILIFRQS
jgi:SAM-dependent methyltransferase